MTPSATVCSSCEDIDPASCLICGSIQPADPLDLGAIQARLDATGPVARQEFPEAISDITALVAEIHRLRTELAGMTDLKDRALTKQDSLRDELTREERAHGQTIDERDRATAMADRLAAALAPADVIGEHSGMNDPWQNALDYAAEQPST